MDPAIRECIGFSFRFADILIYVFLRQSRKAYGRNDEDVAPDGKENRKLQQRKYPRLLMSRAAILLKSPPRVPTTDAYVQQLDAAGYTPYFVEVLESVFSNVQMLDDVVRSGPNDGSGFIGVAITSSRAADAWIQALKRVANPGSSSLEIDSEISELFSGDWSKTPFYVVGESTRRALMQMTTLQPSKFSESLILGATQTGSSESLAQFILHNLPPRRIGEKLLYLTGDKNKDTFRLILTENGVEIEELMVYETKAASDLGKRIARIAKEIANGAIWWRVFS